MVLRGSVSVAGAAQTTGVWPRTLRHAVCAGRGEPEPNRLDPGIIGDPCFCDHAVDHRAVTDPARSILQQS
jgi:hypothetical protein